MKSIVKLFIWILSLLIVLIIIDISYNGIIKRMIYSIGTSSKLGNNKHKLIVSEIGDDHVDTLMIDLAGNQFVYKIKVEIAGATHDTIYVNGQQLPIGTFDSFYIKNGDWYSNYFVVKLSPPSENIEMCIIGTFYYQK